MTRQGLGREGWSVNHKLVYRLYNTDGLGVRAKRRRKRASHFRVVPAAATTLNQRWSMDFVHDCLDDGRRFRALTGSGRFSRRRTRVGLHTRGDALPMSVERSSTKATQLCGNTAHSQGSDMSFHAPGEAARILAEAIDYARQCQMAVGMVTPLAPAAPSAPPDRLSGGCASTKMGSGGEAWI